ncbi:MAG: hypothetical protein IPN77_32330 [Sandaracinaceae bacterium]|nr:hypothetical protein [Sandaracinaceae bacterium]
MPYAIAEASFAVRRVQPAREKQPAVFFVHDAESIQHHLERHADDARIEHSFVLDVDTYGNVRLSAKVAYPRASSTKTAQLEGLCAWTQGDFSNHSADDAHRLGVQLWQRIHQLKGLVYPKGRPLRRAELVPKPEDPFNRMGAVRQFDLVQAERHSYWTDDLTARSWTEAGDERCVRRRTSRSRRSSCSLSTATLPTTCFWLAATSATQKGIGRRLALIHYSPT